MSGSHDSHLGTAKSAGIAAVLLLVLAAGCGGGSSSGGAGGDQVGELAKLVNDYRASVGCKQLTWDSRLAGVAEAHSVDMRSRSYFSHTSPDGVGLEDRLRRAGYSTGAENIAAGQGLAKGVLDSWISSSTHKANLDNCSYAFHGAGVSKLGGIWTHIVAR